MTNLTFFVLRSSLTIDYEEIPLAFAARALWFLGSGPADMLLAEV
jgi:hypothetical protein